MPAPFAVYVHVPFCARRCGYCDFNTYVAGRDAHQAFVRQAAVEIELAGAELERLGEGGRAAASVFFGGGTPTVLAAEELVELHDAVCRVFGLAPGAEVTAEANPDSVDAAYLGRLAEAGFTRVSFGMQSAVPAVLSRLDRTHDPERVPVVAEAARRAGLEASVDLIYGTPGETLADWERSVRAALDLGLSHVSAYALTLAPGTAMARQIRAGRLAAVDPDEQADKYELADALFEDAGLAWYEISNWARPGFESRHNLGYWTGGEWWGIGPGAHSSLGARRWWNLKLPRRWGQAVERGEMPWQGWEELDPAALGLERLMLRLRTARGLSWADLPRAARAAVPGLIEDGLVDAASAGGGPAGGGAAGGGAAGGGARVVLTRRGRLLADLVTRRLAAD